MISLKRLQEDAEKRARDRRYLQMAIAMSRAGASYEEMKRAVGEAKRADEQANAEQQQATGTHEASGAVIVPFDKLSQ